MQALTSLPGFHPQPSTLFDVRLGLLRLFAGLPGDDLETLRQEIRGSIHLVRSSGQSFDDTWSRCCSLVLAGHASKVHAIREDFLAA